MIRRTITLVIPALLLATTVAAQGGTEASYLAAADSGRLVPAASLSSFGRHVVEGLTLLATRPTTVPALHEAVHQFELAQQERRQDPWPWYGLARANLALASSGTPWAPSRTRPFGIGYYDAFLRTLQLALESDPGFAPAYRFLARVVVAEPERQQPEWVARALSTLPALQADPAAVSLARGRFERADGRLAEARGDFEAYSTAGGDRGLALLERARTDAAADSLPAAATAYLAGLDSSGAAGRRAYRLDLAWIASPAELAAFDAVPADSLRPWVARFFDKRDAADIRLPGERLQEHLRRWVFVHRAFPLSRPASSTAWGPGWFPTRLAPCYGSDSTRLEQFGAGEPVDTADPRHRERILDDRAIIYMRHGRPLQDVFSRNGLMTVLAAPEDPAAARRERVSLGEGAGQMTGFLGPGDAAEAWAYSIAGRPRVYQFVGSQQLGQSAPTTLLWFPERPWLLEQRGAVDPDFTRLAYIAGDPRSPLPGGFLCLPSAQRMQTRSRIDVAIGATTDGNPLHFPFPATPLVQANAIADAGDSTGRLVLAYGIPGDRVAPTLVDGKLTYPLEYRLVAVDSAGRVVRRHGSLNAVVPDTLGKGQYLSGVLELQVPTGNWRLGFAVQEPGTARGGAVSIPGLRLGVDRPIDVSGLFLGQRGNAAFWSGGGRSVPVTPSGSFVRGTTLDLFYQVSGVAAGDGFRTDITVHRFDNDRRGGRVVQLGLDELSTGTETAVQRGVDVSRLRPGEYLLEVVVSRPDGSDPVRRERVFSIQER